MGMPGMTNEAVAAYAATGDEAKQDKADNSKMTVAEFRNKINHITHYYDKYDIDDFLLDNSIDLKLKFSVLFGKFIANLIDYNKIDEVLKEMK